MVCISKGCPSVLRKDRIEHLHLKRYRERMEVPPRRTFLPYIQIFDSIYKPFEMNRGGFGDWLKKKKKKGVLLLFL